MGFFASFYHSLFDVAWLAAVRREFKRGLKFFFLFDLLVSALLAGMVVLILLITVNASKKDFIANLPDFRAEITSGTLRVDGIIQPFTQQIPQGPFLFVLDTISSSSPSVQSLVRDPKGDIIVINRQRIEVFSESRNERQNYEFADLENGTLTKADVAAALTWATGPYGVISGFILLLVTLFITIAVGHFGSLVVVSSVALIVATLLKRPWRYAELFTVGLFTPVFPLLIFVVATVIGFGVPYLYSLTLLAFLLAVIITAKRLPPENVTALPVEKPVAPPSEQ